MNSPVRFISRPTLWRRVGALALAAFGATFLGTTSMAAAVAELPLIGRSAIVTNDVEGQLPNAAERKKVVVNEDIFLDETMYTVSDSSMVVEFRDGSTLELGPDSVFTIDRLVFNPEKSTTEKAVNVLQGTFRYVSGFTVDKQTVDIKTPSGTLGIRGSVAIGLVDPGAPTFIFVAQGVATFSNGAGSQELVAGRAIAVTSPNAAPSLPSNIPPQVIAQTVAAILKKLPPAALTEKRPPLDPQQAARFAKANALALEAQREQQKKLAALPLTLKPPAGNLAKELPLLLQAAALGLLASKSQLQTEAQLNFLREAQKELPNAVAALERLKAEQQKFNAVTTERAIATVLTDMARAGVPANILADAAAAVARKQPQLAVAIAQALAKSAPLRDLPAIAAALVGVSPRTAGPLEKAMSAAIESRRDVPAAALAQTLKAIETEAAEAQRLANADTGGKAGKGGAADQLAKEKVLAAILSGTEEGQKLLQKYFEQAHDPKEVTKLAQELIEFAKSNPALKDIGKAQAVADQITKLADDSINSVHVLKIAVDPKLVLTGKQKGYEFGPPDLKKFANFETILPKDPRIGGVNLRGLRSPDTAPLLGSGLAGVHKVALDVPKGKYRIILITGNTGIPALTASPLGQVITVNGHEFRVAGGGNPESWQGLVTLGTSSTDALGGDIGGALILEGSDADGILNIVMAGDPGNTFLAALVIEPLDDPSVLTSQGAPVDFNQATRAEAIAQIDNAVGNLLSEIATGAGPDQVAQTLGLQNPPTPPAVAISAN